MRRVGLIACVIVLAGVTAAYAGGPQLRASHAGTRATTAGWSNAAALTNLRSMYSQQQLEAGVFVGSEFCLACHTGKIAPDETEWRETNHSHVLRKPMGMYSLVPGSGVLANYLGDPSQDDFMMGLDFNQVSGTPFDALKPNAPILSYDASTDQYFIQLGPDGLKLLVAATWAGMSEGNGQRYMVRIPVSDTPTGYSNAIYFAPFAWGGSGYSSNASSWYDGNTPKYAPGISSSDLASLQGQNYLKNCVGCHITGVRSNGVTAQGEYVTHPYPAALVAPDSPDYPDLDGDGIPDLANIGCESCHGPGSAHILAGGDPSKIVNPEDISNNQERSATCLQCHVEIESSNGTWGYTYDEADNKGFMMTNPPDDLSKYQVFTGALWPDGVHYIAARIDDFKSSAHYQGAHGIACNDCHDAMAETMNDSQVRDEITRSGNTYTNVNVDDDSFCMACHHDPYFAAGKVTADDVANWKAAGFNAPIPDSIRDAIEEHTHHPYGADRMLGLSRCITCHMSPTAGHGSISGYSHTFWPARPEDTIAFADATGMTYGATGNPNACSVSCHRGKVILFSDVPANLSPNSMKFGTQDDVNLAQHLVKYFGPGGLWWDTSPAESSGN